MTVIAALLTLVGYSMNDTIVIFDRIRENLKMSAARAAGIGDEPGGEPDAEPDGDDVGADVFDGDRAVPVRRTGAERILICAGVRHYRGNVFFGIRGQSDCVVLAWVGGPAGHKDSPRAGRGAPAGHSAEECGQGGKVRR